MNMNRIPSTLCVVAVILLNVDCSEAQQGSYSQQVPTNALQSIVDDTLMGTVDPRVLDLTSSRCGELARFVVREITPPIDLSRLSLPDGGVWLGQEIETLRRDLDARKCSYQWFYRFGLTIIDIEGSLSGDKEIKRTLLWGINRVYRTKLFYSENTKEDQNLRSIPNTTNDVYLCRLEKQLLQTLAKSFHMCPEKHVPLLRRSANSVAEDVINAGSFTTWGCKVEVTLLNGNYIEENPGCDPSGRELSITYSYLPLSIPADAYEKEFRSQSSKVYREYGRQKKMLEPQGVRKPDGSVLKLTNKP